MATLNFLSACEFFGGVARPNHSVTSTDSITMLWVKAFHVIFMVTWFAGLFYLPRLFVYHVGADDDVSKDRFETMERKLFIIMTVGAIATTVFGAWLLSNYAWIAYGSSFWLLAKMALVAGLFVFHGYCFVLMRDLRRHRNRYGHVFYRWLNEVPVLFLVGIVILVIVKPT
jgi:putative membrane protein